MENQIKKKTWRNQILTGLLLLLILLILIWLIWPIYRKLRQRNFGINSSSSSTATTKNTVTQPNSILGTSFSIQTIIGAGPKGEKGDTGQKGQQGTDGVQGLAGIIGSIGLTGLTGPTGATGPQGPTGSSGSGDSDLWQLNSGVLSPDVSSQSVAIGGTATSSALFLVDGTTGNTKTNGKLALWDASIASDSYLNIDDSTRKPTGSSPFYPLHLTSTYNGTGLDYGVYSTVNSGSSNAPGSLRGLRGDVNYNSNATMNDVLNGVTGFVTMNSGTGTGGVWGGDFVTVINSGVTASGGSADQTAVGVRGFSVAEPGSTVDSVTGGWFDAQTQATDSNTNLTGTYARIETTDGISAKNVIGTHNNLFVGQSSTVTGSIKGIFSENTLHSGSSVTGSMIGSDFSLVNDGTIAGDMKGLNISLDGSGGSTAANIFGADINVAGGVTATNNAYGVRVGSVTGGTTNNYGLYVNGASGGSGNSYGELINTGAAATIGLLVQGHSGQTGNYEEIRDNNSTLLQWVNPFGYFQNNIEILAGSISADDATALTNSQIGINRDPLNGQIFDGAQNAFQFTHVNNSLQLETYNSSGGQITANAIYINASGQVGIGDGNPGNQLSVLDSQSAGPVAKIFNSDTSNSSEGLAVKLGFTGAGNTGNEFVSFLNGNNTEQGGISSDGASGVTYQTGAGDFAEYFTKDNPTDNLSVGTIVCQGTKGVHACSSEDKIKIIGVVSAHPGFTGGVNGPNKVIVALTGQVPINIDPNSKAISPGDPITSSPSTPGMGTKAINNGAIVAKAENYWIPGSETKQIMAYINISSYDLGINPDLNVTGNLETQGTATFDSKAIFMAIVDFFDKIIFHSAVNFLATPTFNNSTAGTAIIKSNATKVQVSFQTPYTNIPIVTASPTSAVKLDWWRITDVSLTGFTIEIASTQSEDLSFNWIALSIANPQTTLSNAGSQTPLPSP